MFRYNLQYWSINMIGYFNMFYVLIAWILMDTYNIDRISIIPNVCDVFNTFYDISWFSVTIRKRHGKQNVLKVEVWGYQNLIKRKKYFADYQLKTFKNSVEMFFWPKHKRSVLKLGQGSSISYSKYSCNILVIPVGCLEFLELKNQL